MPQNGETNQKFGFFKNLCCGKEIALPKGSEFPSCPNHPGLTTSTSWVPLVDNIVHLINKRRSQPPLPKFKVGDVVTFVGIGPSHGSQGNVTEVIEGSLDNVHRFHVRFNDGTWIKCFSFELELFEGESSKAASGL
jgi:hypothetical protein